jgi:hypothetical protein
VRRATSCSWWLSRTTVCALAATPDRLDLRVEAADAETMERMQGVVIDHLERFAFREDLGAVAWQQTEQA